MSDETYTVNKYTQYIPTPTEVINHFRTKGIEKESFAVEWYTKQSGLNWKDAKGNKIMNWSKLANCRIEDIKTYIASKSRETSEPKVNNNYSANTLSQGIKLLVTQFEKLFTKQNGGFSHMSYRPNLIKILSKIKSERKFNDMELYEWLCEFDFQEDFSLENIDRTIGN